ncbi:MAG: DUF2752 domain-containing protein [Clostridia bacterium]|nr:DUF2752 domain-containing protein [Clostridia bacterium]
MTHERRKIIFFFIVFNFLLLLFTLFFCFFFSPNDVIENGKNYTCVFQKIFNIYCPGCGGTRSLGYLLSFDFKNSFIYFPPIFVGIFLILWMEILFIISIKKNSFEPIKNHKYFEFLLIPISIMLTFLVRNVFLFFGIDLIGDFLI